MSIIRHSSPLNSSTASCLLRIGSSLPCIQQSSSQSCQQSQHNQVRYARFIPRPRRPYTFSQLVTLSDGSTYVHRTSSPAPVHKSTKDTRNTQLWNPSSQKLMNIEADEAGRLRAFRSRFGRGWDNKRGDEIEVDAEGIEVGDEVEIVETITGPDSDATPDTIEVKTDGTRKELKPEDEVNDDNLFDLISSPEYDSGVVLGPKEKKKKKKGKK